MRIAERFLIGVAWFMGVTMIAIAATHLVFINTDLRPADGGNAGWMPLIGEVPILWMILGWEIPTAGLVISGLIYHSRRPRLGGAAIVLGTISYSIHLWYFVIVPILTLLVLAAVVVRSRRFVAQQSATSFISDGAR